MAADVEYGGPGESLMRAERAASRGVEPLARAGTEREGGGQREARQRRDPVAGRKQQRHQCRHDRRGERMVQRPGEFETAAVGARFGQRPSPWAEDHTAGTKLAGRCRRHEAFGISVEPRDTSRMDEPHARGERLAEQRVEHRS